MRTPILAACACALPLAAAAQSSATLFGVVDLSLQHVRSDGAGSATRMASGSNTTSRLGLRGQEDLGGMAAGFWLEGTLLANSGQGSTTNINNQSSGSIGGSALTFDRRSTVSLISPWGEARLGRDYVPTYWNVTRADPFFGNGVGSVRALVGTGAVNAVTFVRASNMVGYYTPALGGFYAQVNHAWGNNPSSSATSKDGAYDGFRAGYASGPAELAVSRGRTRYAAGDYIDTNLFGVYDLRFVRLSALWNESRVDAPAPLKQRDWLLGAVVPIGASEFKLAYTRTRITSSPTGAGASLIALGYVYNLSKRSAAYVHYGRVSNRGGATFSNGPAAPRPGGGTQGTEIGLRHSF